uniref:Reverse transcriptase domain-containing protein n=1 Tax=Tanacetum cinerariifolium TaxID=118510 RepID=A0A699S874_TANCI|nr:reverse transcriptase domain-containing protein [Tanacetum cinerariifolium]
MYADRFHELARLVPHSVTPKNNMIKRYIYGLAPQIRGMVAATKPTTIQSAILKVEVLTDEAIRNVSLKKNSKKTGNGREPTKDRNVKGDNKRSRTGREFAITTNLLGKSTWDRHPNDLQGRALIGDSIEYQKPNSCS